MTLLIDGGMGLELRARGVNPDAKSAGNALTKSAKIVQEIHEEFINAGAEIITTWNYSLTKHRLGLLNMSDKLNEMTQLAVNITNKARLNVGNSQVRIAGCLPPLRASYEPNEQEFGSMVEEYDEIATYLDSGVDLFLCETMSSANEAAAAAEAASKFGKPLWVSWTLRDDTDGLLRSGETLDLALSKIEDLPVEAVLLNCCDVTTIANAIPALQTKTTRMIGAYANSFTPISKDWKRDGDHLRELRELTPEDYAHQALQWRANGAQIIGGCCGIGPVHISHMRTVIDRNE